MLIAGYAQEVSSRRKDRRKAQLQPGSKELEGVNGLAWFESRSKREHAQRRPKLLTEVGVSATERRCSNCDSVEASSRPIGRGHSRATLRSEPTTR